MRISIIGSGNVATHLAAAFANAGHNIVQIWSRDFHHAGLLAYHTRSEAVERIELIDKNIDLAIIAVKDDAIANIASQLNLGNTLLVHTSGSTSIDILKGSSAKIGVLYPLQTLSKDKEVDFSHVPLLIEGNSEEVVQILKDLASSASSQVLEVNSEKRLSLHVAAVFASNFVNSLYSAAKEVLDTQGLDFQLLRPLIAETARKAQHSNPKEVQTGPAIRNDQATIHKHLEFLSSATPQLQALYETLSQHIINFYHKP
jgi:predicted short-subunit dehydrogenase-like oxidoreductase (DUF2520 family)